MYARRFDREIETHGVLHDEAVTVSVECNVHRPFDDSPEEPRVMHVEADAGTAEYDATNGCQSQGWRALRVIR